MIDKSDIFLSGFLLGTFSCILAGLFVNYPNWHSQYKELLRHTENLIDSQKGIVSVSDLVFKAGISPVKAAKFLQKLTRQLGIEPEVDDTGIIYYGFNTGKTISSKRQLKSKDT